MTPDPILLSGPHPLDRQGGASPRTHIRHRSDITPDVRRLIKREEENEELLTQSITTPSVGSLEAVVEGNEPDEEVGGARNKVGGAKASEPLIPPIDIEINVTINVDSGQVVLLSEDTRYEVWQTYKEYCVIM